MHKIFKLAPPQPDRGYRVSLAASADVLRGPPFAASEEERNMLYENTLPEQEWWL
jgi:hypothetical protein